MNDNVSYVPEKCSMKSCAYPNVACVNCLGNASLYGKHAAKLKDPQKNYKFVRAMMRAYFK